MADSFETALRRILSGRRAVVLGVGHPQRGDDALGPALVARLQGARSLCAIDGEELPENVTGPVREAAPQVIVLVDAVDFAGAPGEVVLLTAAHCRQRRLNTHHASLGMVMEYLAHETGAPVWLLGVQPLTLQPGAPISDVVDATLNQLVRLMRNIDDEDPL